MAINANDLVIKGSELEKVAAARPIAAPVIAPIAEPVTVVVPVATSEQPKAPVQTTPKSGDHHVLIVDGKHKKVAKRSQYLLDMMTID